MQPQNESIDHHLEANSLKNDPKVINGWAFFDCANSAYSLVIVTAIFPAYFLNIAPDTISLAGWNIPDSSLLSYALSLAFFLLTIVLPILSGIADYSGQRKTFMRLFSTFGAISCISIYFFKSSAELWLGVSAYICAAIGYAGSLVFYNSYLPVIATEDMYDKVSAKGFSYGYIGSTILLIINLLMIQLSPDNYKGFAAQLSFLMVGIWWLSFSQITYNRLPKDETGKPMTQLLTRGYKELYKTWQNIREYPVITRFLAAFFFYNAGVQAVLYLATVFADKELHFESAELIILVLILQIVAAIGAWLFAKISDAQGNKFALLILLSGWVAICVIGFYLTGKTAFYALGGFLGLVMGGIQSLSRSTYSKLLPENVTDTTAFFSFLDVPDKLSVILGTFTFGFVGQLMGSIRYSLLALGLYFILGLLLLITISIKDKKIFI
jgi:MFS transporter, UMF1 family